MHVVRSDAAPPLDCSVGKDGYNYWRIALKGYHFQTRHSTYMFIWMIVINLPNKYISDMQVSVNNKIRGLPTLMELWFMVLIELRKIRLEVDNGVKCEVVSFVSKFTLIKNKTSWSKWITNKCFEFRLYEGERRLFEHSWNDAQE